ncbi:hypothetical protein ACB092_02G232200 [Castanea dentata]
MVANITNLFKKKIPSSLSPSNPNPSKPFEPKSLKTQTKPIPVLSFTGGKTKPIPVLSFTGGKIGETQTQVHSARIVTDL